MTAHQLNNIIARCWIQHTRYVYDPYSTEEYREQLRKIRYRVIEELNSTFYANNKDMIDFLKDKPVTSQFIYSKNGYNIVAKYPLKLTDVTYNSSFDKIVQSDSEYVQLNIKAEVDKEKSTTDRGYYYVQCMLLYKEGMTEKEFYDCIKDYFTIK